LRPHINNDAIWRISRSWQTSYVATAVGTSIGRVVDVVGTSSRCWILAAAASTPDSTLAVEFGTMDAADTMGTSSRRAANVVGNAADAVRTSSRRVRSCMLSIFSNYRLIITFFVNIMQV
jgi:hypothetical protein